MDWFLALPELKLEVIYVALLSLKFSEIYLTQATLLNVHFVDAIHGEVGRKQQFGETTHYPIFQVTALPSPRMYPLSTC